MIWLLVSCFGLDSIVRASCFKRPNDVVSRVKQFKPSIYCNLSLSFPNVRSKVPKLQVPQYCEPQVLPMEPWFYHHRSTLVQYDALDVV
uniref:Secreted protein n=1 Tax=Arundo donax TaxID=35708 RepID=A0A0A8YTI0_ARUDO